MKTTVIHYCWIRTKKIAKDKIMCTDITDIICTHRNSDENTDDCYIKEFLEEDS